ncbi:unnamed protein product, partial [Ectocarpus sp. 12 AP-2014]
HAAGEDPGARWRGRNCRRGRVRVWCSSPGKDVLMAGPPSAGAEPSPLSRPPRRQHFPHQKNSRGVDGASRKPPARDDLLPTGG